MLNFIFFLIHTFCFVLFGFKSIKKVWEWQKEKKSFYSGDSEFSYLCPMEIVVTYENPNSEDSIQDNIVAEPVAEYRPTEKPPYAGTSINKAIKDYYACPTNKEKVSVLQWIVENPEFQVLKRYSTAENAVYGLNISQYDDILLSGEMPKNLVIAQKLVANKFDVFLLSNPTSTKSADFVLRKRNCLYYVEGKTSSGGSALSTRMEEGNKQADRIVVNFISYPSLHEIFSLVKTTFYKYTQLKELFLLKGSRLIDIKRDFSESVNFEERFAKLWGQRK